MKNRPPSARPISRRGNFQANDSPSPAATAGPSARPPSALKNTATRLASAAPPPTGSTQMRLGTSFGMPTGRPITQQGLSGISTARIGTTTTGMRQVKDKRYWQAILQSKIQEIVLETDKLVKEKKNLDRETSARKLYEKKVKTSAKELSNLQSTLMDMNLALDNSSAGPNARQHLQNEALALRERNETSQNQLEQIFKERQNKELQNQNYEEKISNEKNKINELIYSLSLDDQNRYREYQIIAEKFKKENADIHMKIEELVKQKEKLSAQVINSQSRLEAVKAHSKLRELVSKRNNLKDEEMNRLTPAQEREKLINEVRMNNQALNSMNKQMKIVSDQLQEKKEFLHQIEQDLEEGSSERHIKYKELRKRDEMMTQFMDAFEINMKKEKQNIETLKNQITFAVEQITLQGMNTKNIASSLKMSALNEKNDLSSQNGLLKEYNKLSIQLKQLKILEKRIQNQLSQMRQEEADLLGDIRKYRNLEALRAEYSTKYEELSSALQELKDKKRVTKNVVQESEKRNQDIKDSLRSNETYRQIAHLEEKLADLTKENKQLEEIVNELHQEYDYSDLKSDTISKVDEYNKILCTDLNGL